MTSAELGENPYLEVALLSFTPDLILIIVIHWLAQRKLCIGDWSKTNRSETGTLLIGLHHSFSSEIKAVYNPTALILVTSSIAIKLMQKCLTSISGDCEQFLAGQC